MIKELQKSLTKLLMPKSKGVPTSMKYISYMVIALSLYLLYYVAKRTMRGSHIEGLESGSGKKTLVLFHMTGCGHCVKLMPEWDAFEKENDSGILTKKLERGEAGDLLEKHEITGFPTIMLLDGNGEKAADYDGERNKGGLLGFCKKNSN